jgi:hypothetical protein
MNWPVRELAVALAAALIAGSVAAAPARPSFADWAAVVVSGDDQAAHEDRATAAFDNARRDVASALERLGFAPANLAQISVHDQGDELTAFGARLNEVAARAHAGCLVYITSHGSPDGVVMKDKIVPPARLTPLIWRACRDRPTAVVVSACFSGRFVPALSATLGARGYVLTAARRDRSSFGCGETDRYPYFDGCVLEDLPQASGFIDLADRVRACVHAREDEEGMRPRSEPQLFVGADFPIMAPPFARPRG